MSELKTIQNSEAEALEDDDLETDSALSFKGQLACNELCQKIDGQRSFFRRIIYVIRREIMEWNCPIFCMGTPLAYCASAQFEHQ
jgi:hypothetical protein